jgi:hypothetical protein
VSSSMHDDLGSHPLFSQQYRRYERITENEEPDSHPLGGCPDAGCNHARWMQQQHSRSVNFKQFRASRI